MKNFILISFFLFTYSMYGQSNYSRYFSTENPGSIRSEAKNQKFKSEDPRCDEGVDLSKYFPEAGDQGTEKGSCWAYSVAYLLSSFNNKLNEVKNINSNYNVFSAEYIYHAILREYKYECNKEKINALDALEYSLSNGALMKSDFNKPTDCSPKVTEPDILKARGNSFPNYTTIKFGAGNIETLENLLCSGSPVIVSMKTDIDFANFNASNSYWNESYGTAEDHAMVVVGFKGDYFKVLNSYGKFWGKNGYIWIHKSLFEDDDITNYFVSIEKRYERTPPPKVSDVDDKKIIDTWFKEGYYVAFSGIYISLRRIDKKLENFTIYVYDKSDKIREEFSMKTNEQGVFKDFSVDGKNYRFTYMRKGQRGINRLEPAILFRCETI